MNNMVEWYWLLVAFVAGAFIALIIMGAMTSAKITDLEVEHQKEINRIKNNNKQE